MNDNQTADHARLEVYHEINRLQAQNNHLSSDNAMVRAELENLKSVVFADQGKLAAELAQRRNEHFELYQWFQHHHVTGTLTLEEIDVMTPKQMADHVYERMSDKAAKFEEENARLQATKAHMNFCRSLLKTPKDEVLGESIKALQKDNGRLVGEVEELQKAGKFVAQLNDDLNKAQSEIHTLTWKLNNCEEDLQRHKQLLAERDNVLEMARVSLEQCHKYITGQLRWVSLETITQPLAAINKLLPPEQKQQ